MELELKFDPITGKLRLVVGGCRTISEVSLGKWLNETSNLFITNLQQQLTFATYDEETNIWTLNVDTVVSQIDSTMIYNLLEGTFDEINQEITNLSQQVENFGITYSQIQGALVFKEDKIVLGTTAQYWRGDKTWQTLNTSVVPEGSNQYFTTARARAALSQGQGITYDPNTGIISANPSQIVDPGSVQNAVAAMLVNSPTASWNTSGGQVSLTINLSSFTTSQLAEGSNLYWTQARFDNAFSAKTTSQLAEGSNLYFTVARARTAFSAGPGIYISPSGVISTTGIAGGGSLDVEQVQDIIGAMLTSSPSLAWLYNDSSGTLFANVRLNPFTTDDLDEGTSNLYYTDARARAAIDVTGGLLTYNSTTGVIGLTADAFDSRYVQLAGSYANPTWITSLALSKITGLTAALDGREPTITAGTTAQYWRGDKTWQTLNTSVVPEGTNLYYTDLRARLAISVDGGVLSYNPTTGVIYLDPAPEAYDARYVRVSAFYSNPSWITSLDISKITGLTAALDGREPTITAGTTAQYWRGDKAWVTLNTTAVPEGSNQYFTTARARDAISVDGGILSYIDGIIYLYDYSFDDSYVRLDGSYANPSWITSLAWSKITGAPTISGTTNYVSKFTGANTLGNSQIFDNGINVLIASVVDNTFAKLQTPNISLGVNQWNYSSEGTQRLYYVNGGGAFYKVPLGSVHGFRFGDKELMTIYGSVSATDLYLGAENTSSRINLYFLNASGSTLSSSNRIAVLANESNSDINLFDYDGTTFRNWIKTVASTNQLQLSNSLYVNYGGDVGIGTTTPTQKLHVNEGFILSKRSGDARVQVDDGNQTWSIASGQAGAGIFSLVQENVAIRLAAFNNGQFRFNAYTTPSSFTGTAAGMLAFDSSGNVISRDNVRSDSANDGRYTQFGHTHPIANITGLQAALDGKSNNGHNHDDRYYTEGELNTSGAGGSVHWDNISNKPGSFNPNSHNHDDRYYTESESDGRYTQFGHNHDDRYYTEGELNTSGGGGSVHWNNVSNKPFILTSESDPTGVSAVGFSWDSAETLRINVNLNNGVNKQGTVNLHNHFAVLDGGYYNTFYSVNSFNSTVVFGDGIVTHSSNKKWKLAEAVSLGYSPTPSTTALKVQIDGTDYFVLIA